MIADALQRIVARVEESSPGSVAWIADAEHRENIRLTRRRSAWLLFCSLDGAIKSAQSLREDCLVDQTYGCRIR
jgi:hypothetical protein